MNEKPSILASLVRVSQDAGAIWRLFVRTLYFTFRGKREKGAVVKQMYEIGNGSMFFMTVTMAFIGAIILFQTGLQSKKLVPDFSLVGATYLKLLVRDLAASVGALPLATRVGAGIAAELGSMVVTDQVDALRMSGADPVDYLVVPRFLASLFVGSAVLIIGGFVAYGSGMLVAYLMFDINPRTFINLIYLEPGDLIIGLVKCFAYGGTIAIVSSQRGLATFGGSEGVGWATTEAVVGSCFAIIVLNLIISSVGYGLGL